MNFMVKELATVYAKGYKAGCEESLKGVKAATNKFHEWLLDMPTSHRIHPDDIAAKLNQFILEAFE